eukprot:GHVP01049384.1.p1 GENE.GHVP01049384.1~~GHVP01049384.1.p1  ORF type:complete len:231 (-),score=7.11 GHVP01049384.1:222-914(-)
MHKPLQKPPNERRIFKTHIAFFLILTPTELNLFFSSAAHLPLGNPHHHCKPQIFHSSNLQLLHPQTFICPQTIHQSHSSLRRNSLTDQPVKSCLRPKASAAHTKAAQAAQAAQVLFYFLTSDIELAENLLASRLSSLDQPARRPSHDFAPPLTNSMTMTDLKKTISQLPAESSHCVSKSWKHSRTILIYKKDHSNDPNNCSPITLQNVIFKILVSIMASSISEWCPVAAS